MGGNAALVASAGTPSRQSVTDKSCTQYTHSHGAWLSTLTHRLGGFLKKTTHTQFRVWLGVFLKKTTHTQFRGNTGGVAAMGMISLGQTPYTGTQNKTGSRTHGLEGEPTGDRANDQKRSAYV